MGIRGGGFWVEVRFKDYSSRSTYNHIYYGFWLWEAFNMFNIYMYWERNPLNVFYLSYSKRMTIKAIIAGITLLFGYVHLRPGLKKSIFRVIW